MSEFSTIKGSLHPLAESYNQVLIFTDLDGTLIDHDTYEFLEAVPVLNEIRSKSIPVIICSSKTRAEIEVIRREIDLAYPFIVENGGAIFVPRNTLNMTQATSIERGQYDVVELGVPYAALCEVFTEVKKACNLSMKGFSEMTAQEIAEHTGLSLKEASLAAKREYSEPFIFSDTLDQFRLLENETGKKGLAITKGGRFYHLIGQNNKGRATRILTSLYADTYPGRSIRTVGLGDSANDIPMLRNVDMPIVIRKKNGDWERVNGIEAIVYSDKAGPRGWAEEVSAILSFGT